MSTLCVNVLYIISCIGQRCKMSVQKKIKTRKTDFLVMAFMSSTVVADKVHMESNLVHFQNISSMKSHYVI